ncbi:FKBP-type peptidyl-prolyl cis-trans isomerase [Sphingomonadaceae bacterium jetA1]|jgi:FKBP-type peptidyl-prolyl cis-trans isomerase FkpA|uniref:FKBP-type peptidyl-prolyl cis-trans isomerase n=1 Tax=Facivitalis istanbulensis TaxID=3075838 RepID=UPI00349514FE
MSVTAVPLRPVRRAYLVWLWVALVAAIVVAALVSRQGDAALLREARGAGVTTTASGLQYKVIEAGQGGGHPTATDVALINYTGRLIDGTVFGKSQQPTPMPLSGVLPGFAEALKLMPKGAKYRFWLPSQIGYGAKGAGTIPPNATLVFDVELIDFIPETVLRQMQAQQSMMGGAPGAAPGSVPGVPSPR